MAALLTLPSRHGGHANCRGVLSSVYPIITLGQGPLNASEKVSRHIESSYRITATAAMASQPAVEHGAGTTSVRFIKHSGELALLTCGASGKIALRSLDDPSSIIRTFANKAATSQALYCLAVHPTRPEFMTGGAEHVRVRARSFVILLHP